MIRDFNADNSVDVGGLIADWRAYTTMRCFGDYDDFFGDELSVPIIYEPR